MKIEIEISDKDAATLAHWASVGRTLATATGACEAIRDGEVLSDTETETYSHCAREMRDLRPALDNLHYQARQAIWNIANTAKAVAELEKTNCHQRVAAIEIMKAAGENPLYHTFYDRIVAVLGISAGLYAPAVIEWLRAQDAEVKTSA